MDHKKKGIKLEESSHQRSLVANLVSSLIKEGKVDTTEARAKETRRYVDKMVTLAKEGDGESRRRAFRFLQDKEAVGLLFDEIAEEYMDRQGGYCRVLKLPPRRGDGADMARLMFS